MSDVQSQRQGSLTGSISSLFVSTPKSSASRGKNFGKLWPGAALRPPFTILGPCIVSLFFEAMTTTGGFPSARGWPQRFYPCLFTQGSRRKTFDAPLAPFARLLLPGFVDSDTSSHHCQPATGSRTRPRASLRIQIPVTGLSDIWRDKAEPRLPEETSDILLPPGEQAIWTLNLASVGEEAL